MEQSGSSHSSKLSQRDIRNIKAILMHTDLSMNKIASFFGVSLSTISKIKTGGKLLYVA